MNFVSTNMPEVVESVGAVAATQSMRLHGPSEKRAARKPVPAREADLEEVSLADDSFTHEENGDADPDDKDGAYFDHDAEGQE